MEFKTRQEIITAVLKCAYERIPAIEATHILEILGCLIESKYICILESFEAFKEIVGAKNEDDFEKILNNCVDSIRRGN